MTEPSAAQPASPPASNHQWTQLLVDVGPVAIFMIVYNVLNKRMPGEAIFVATGVFIVATLAALLYAKMVQKRVPPMLLVTAVVVTVFGGLTLFLHDSLFIKLKPTVINGLYAATIFGGLLFKVNVWKLLFQSAFTLTDKTWNTLAIRWGLFFIFLALVNEYVWRNYSEAFWANFKLVGMMPMTFLFALANLPMILKDPEMVAASAAEKTTKPS